MHGFRDLDAGSTEDWLARSGILPYAAGQMLSKAEIGLGILWYVVFVVSTTFHEAAHGWMARLLGDSTAYDAGLVTLDPVPHIRRSPFGMLLIPLISFSYGGWMIGWASTPYDPFWGRTHRRKAAIMALSGPAANLALVLIAAVAIRVGMHFGAFVIPDASTFAHLIDATGASWMPGLATLMSVLFSLNLLLFVFNLLPLPPLDGSSVITLFFSNALFRRYQDLLDQPVSQMVGLLVAWRILGWIFFPVWDHVLDLLYW
jgi:Zn-dependent protease